MKGLSYNRLKLVDTDQNIAYSNIKAVQLNLSEAYFEVYPNPAEANASTQIVVGTTPSTAIKLQLIDARGPIVYRRDLITSPHEKKLEVLDLNTNYPSEIYWIHLILGDQILCKKLLIR